MAPPVSMALRRRPPSWASHKCRIVPWGTISRGILLSWSRGAATGSGPPRSARAVSKGASSYLGGGRVRTAELRTLLSERVVVLDGAWGTMLQGAGLTPEDYRGEMVPADHA